MVNGYVYDTKNHIFLETQILFCLKMRQNQLFHQNLRCKDKSRLAELYKGLKVFSVLVHEFAGKLTGGHGQIQNDGIQFR